MHPLLQLATRLSDLADSFDKFHETGMEHFKAATSVISQLQGIADICQNDSTNTISSSIQAVRDCKYGQSSTYLSHLCNTIQTILSFTTSHIPHTISVCRVYE